jgi:hypothetical protein
MNIQSNVNESKQEGLVTDSINHDGTVTMTTTVPKKTTLLSLLRTSSCTKTKSFTTMSFMDDCNCDDEDTSGSRFLLKITDEMSHPNVHHPDCTKRIDSKCSNKKRKLDLAALISNVLEISEKF